MYLLDANVFIDSKNRWYGFDICPGFWQWLVAANRTGRVYSIEKVKDELRAGNDDLAEWATNLPTSFFVQTTQSTQTSFTATSTWADSKSHQYTRQAIDVFLDSADYYLVAQAHERGSIVVTQEAPAPQSRSKIKLPDACDGLGVKWIRLFDLLRDEQVRFVLP